jgi:membrane protease subunit (stomatin/prohibitin family)
MTDRDEIMNGCQLIVAESQVAMLVSGGKIADVFEPGTHKLTTKNIPILTKLLSLPFDFESPYKADVYYVNTKQFLDLKWGTPSRVMMRDADFGVVRIGARGKYSFRVNDAPTFMKEIFGTNREYSTSAIEEYLKSIIVSNFADALAEAKIPALDLAASYVELGDVVRQCVIEDFNKLGIAIVNVIVERITLPEEVEKAMDQRSSIGVLKDEMNTFTQYQTAQAIREAANNEGSGAAGAGVGLGAGIAMGQAMTNAMSNQNQNTQPSQNGPTCPNCGVTYNPGAKFCSNCGNKLGGKKFCTNCGNEITPNAKFCEHCGQKQ